MLACIGIYVFLAAVPTFFWCVGCEALALFIVPAMTIIPAVVVAAVLGPFFSAGHLEESFPKRLLVFVVFAAILQGSCMLMPWHVDM